MPARKTFIVLGMIGSLLSSGDAGAVEQTSPSFRHRAGHFGALVAGPLGVSASLPRFASSIVTLGGIGDQGSFVGPVALRALLPGFDSIAAGASPSLDLDGDGIPNLLDLDDDADGLPDVDETNTGAFVSPNNTGTSPFLADSDADGFGDGAEIAAGSDPTDPASRPLANAVPLLGVALRLFLLLALLATGRGLTSLRRGRST